MKNKRMTFLKYLRDKVFKVPLGEIPPWYLMIIYRILFPLRYFYESQNNLRYNFQENMYYINNYRFTGELFEQLTIDSPAYEWFRVVKREDGRITIERKCAKN